MSNRGGRDRDRDRSRRDYPSRYEDNKGNGSSGRGGGSSGNNGNPPSRHLWVGNLSHNIVEDELTHPFIRFGPLEKVAFQSGRSYAFINFEVDEDAIDAMRSLQGFPLAGNPLRIEFAKADKPSTVTHDEDYSRDERRSAIRGSPFPQREFRGRHGSPEPHYSDKSKMSDKNPEPSEVLWIGFPAQLKVDESILDRAFSPFGEIVKISTFPGRSYAFVRYRNQNSACRAIDALKGKLFGNPRVHICFAKSESGSSSSGKSSFNGPRSPSYKSSGLGGSSENFRQDWSFPGEQNISSPNMFGNWDSRDSDFNNRGYEPRKIGEKGAPLGVSQEFYEHQNSPSRERHFHQGDFPQNYPKRGPFFEDPHGLPEDAPYLHVAKKLKSGSSPPERELPEYAFSELERQKHVFPRPLPDFPHREPFDKSFDAGNFTYGQTFNHPPNSPLVRMDRHDGWKPYDTFQMGPGARQSNFIEKKRFTPEPDNSSSSEWKWEGTIAKGGTPICRARCFPVGKVLDIALPEFLDCTARTSLDMLSKHYYQAVGVWVVFFVPGSDADIEFYNEFMHYLEEKQRAAVSKVDDKTTLFLVPPSEFSEKVLKVPGKLSISGVILRLEYPGLNQGPMHIEREMKNENLSSYNENILYPNSSFSSARIHTNPPSISELGNSGTRSNLSFLGSKFPAAPLVSNSAHSEAGMSEAYDGRNHDYPSIQPRTSGPNWAPHNPHNFNSNRALPSHLFSGAVEPIAEERHLLSNINSTQHSSGNSGIPFGGNMSSHQEMRNFDPSTPVGSLQPEQLAQLAATLLEQQRHLGSSMSTSAMSDPRQNRFNESEASSRPSYAAENNLANSELSTSQFGHHGLQLQKQQQQQQMMPNVPQFSQTVQRELPREVNGNQQLADHGLQEDGDADPQRRLQATLKLAATLLQQIHQEKGN